MKTTMKQFTASAFLTLLMLVGNVNAEGTQAKASSRENNNESSLQVEKWMIDNTIWNAEEKSFSNISNDNFDSLQVEDWMTETNVREANNFVSEPAEQELKLENWMTDNSTFNGLYSVEQESPLATEMWMTTGQPWFAGEFDEISENALTLENWMINENVW